MKRPSTHQPKGGIIVIVRVVVLVLALMGAILNIFKSLGPQDANIPLEARSLKGMISSSGAAGYKRALYQHEPANTRTEDDFQAASNECGNHNELYFKYFAQGQDYRSSSNEDKTIYTTFFKSLLPNEMKDMTYVELGGFDGQTESNSRFFDVCLGWTGLLIEANPSAYPLLVKNRPHAHRLSFAPSCSIEQEAANKTIAFLSTPRAWSNAAQVDTANSASYTEITPIQVPCGSLTPVLLDLFPGGLVTFFSLDVEGAEALIVQNIDFDQVFIEILIAENQNSHCPINGPCESRKLTRERMKEAGYTLFENVVLRSDLYIHPKSRFLVEMMGQQRLAGDAHQTTTRMSR